MRTTLLNFLESLGVKFSMDWDDTVTAEIPDIDAVDVEQAMKPFIGGLSHDVVYRAECLRAVFVGGSLNGQVVGRRRCLVPTLHADGTKHCWIVEHVARGRWEVYDNELRHNGRAFFRGYATNKQKANRGEISERIKEANDD